MAERILCSFDGWFMDLLGSFLALGLAQGWLTWSTLYASQNVNYLIMWFE